MTYQEYERTVYDWLLGLQRRQSELRFSTRQKASKGARDDLFIGTEHSRYFSTTFWTIPIAYPGVAGGLINLLFRQKASVFSYEFYVRAPRTVGDDQQLAACLDLAQRLRLLDQPLLLRARPPRAGTKDEMLVIQGKESSYRSLDDLLTDAEDDLLTFLPLVDRLIEEVKQYHPAFVAHRITAAEYARMQELVEQRQLPHRAEDTPPQQLAEDPAPYGASSRPVDRDPGIPLNQIFYGPPGTGKTYETVNEAVRITNPAFPIGERSRRLVREEYRRLVSEGRIVFTTFHQSLSYEDFVEGIKPRLQSGGHGTGEEAAGDLGFTLASGIFRELVDTVRTANRAASMASTQAGLRIDKQLIRRGQPYKMSLGNVRDANDAVIYDYCIANDCISLGYGIAIDFTGVANEREILARIQQQRGDGQSDYGYELTAVRNFVVAMQPGDLVFVPDGLQTIRAVGVVTGDYYHKVDAPIRHAQFRPVRWLYQNIAYPIKTVYGRQFSVQTVYPMEKSVLQAGLEREHDHRPASNNYVLIIDEINRGNVSRIFGELITLLEPDKRLGQPEELTVTLPYSRDTFGVPANLYLIGTMNTADRSVDALDSALRRRFTFRELTARPDLLADRRVGEVELSAVLQTINDRVERLLDKDHRIGHAYFMPIDGTVVSLQAVLASQVIPLLEEYFFGDTEKLRLVLGTGFFERLDTFVSFAPGTGETYHDGQPRYRLLDIRDMSEAGLVRALTELM
ncbi:hypothetical protein LEM8419_01006 [Neolewinella maritima]|uniref:ATPase dynein-related AAA domain-containing protein n=1 Tax=Neolewinella maritima TaxID=1383882 RepID=A0ABM9AYB0_9BACT|nr:AAA family ATPase [Neolewinella maritima]CAH0999706.1 hypothetical protein LEM8419_01006 [Neolewinella maritima]